MQHSTLVPAKINLHLQVVGRRSDGFHELRTLFQSIDLCDRLDAEPAPQECLELEVEPTGAAPADDSNLVLRAARAMQQMPSLRSSGARLRLTKRTPSGAGLGGGSADAAAALVLLNQLWSAGLSLAELWQLAGELGSDVPFFLFGGLALGVGRGEEIYPLPDLPELGVIVVMPEIEIATARIYDRLPRELTWSRPDATVYSFSAGLVRELHWGSLHNDLQPLVLAERPELDELLQRLQAIGPLHAAVTGSGAAVFALFPDQQAAQQAAGQLGSIGRVHVGTTMPRHRAGMPISHEEDTGWR